MGTSSKYPGPRRGYWAAARRQLTAAGRLLGDSVSAHPDLDDVANNGSPVAVIDDDRADHIGDLLRAGLRESLLRDARAFGVRAALQDGGQRLVDVLADLALQGTDALGPLHATDPDERQTEFLTRFVGCVAPASGTVADAAVRHAALQSGSKLFGGHTRFGDSVRSGDSFDRLSSELLCWLFALFFAEGVKELLVTVMAEHLKLAVPVLQLDPTGKIAELLAEKVVNEIPDPCAEQEEAVDEAKPIVQVARTLIPAATDTALGLTGSGAAV